MLCFIIAVLCGPFGAAMLNKTIRDFRLIQQKQDYVYHGTWQLGKKDSNSLWDRRRSQNNNTLWIYDGTVMQPIHSSRVSSAQYKELQKNGSLSCSVFARHDGDKFQYVTEDKLTKLTNFSVALSLLLTLSLWCIFFYCLRWIFITSQVRNTDEKQVIGHPG
jgi:hypothetical protein